MSFELGRERLGAELLDASAVHVARVEIADLALRAAPDFAFDVLASSNSWCSALRLFSRSSWNAPQLDASAGICAVLSQPPFT